MAAIGDIAAPPLEDGVSYQVARADFHPAPYRPSRPYGAHGLPWHEYGSAPPAPTTARPTTGQIWPRQS